MNAKRRSAGEEGHHLNWLLAIFVIAILLALLVPTASAGHWSYRKNITINSSEVPGDLNNFPVLIYRASDTDLAAHAQTNGEDIVFTDRANNARYNHEIENFVKSNGELEAWVRIPSLSGSTNTEISMWYGNSDCGAQENPTGVWDSGYKMVQHLVTANGIDSTSYGNDGTQHGGVTPTTSGQINGADSFDGTNDYVDFGNGASLPESTTFTVSAWVKHNKADDSWDVITDKYKSSAHRVTLAVYLTPAEEFSFTTANGAWSSENDLKTGVVSANQWHHVVAVWDATGTDKYIYLDGDLSNQKDNVIPSRRPCSGADDFTIGGRVGTSEFCLDAVIDEVRISNVVRSAEWITTCFNNQNDPSSFYEVGPEKGTGGTDPVPELPTILLFSVGLLVLAGYVLLRKRRG